MFENSSVSVHHEGGNLTRGEFLQELEKCASAASVAPGLQTICNYVGSTGYLLVRNKGSDDFVVSSNWPYDFATQAGAFVLQNCAILGQFTEEYPAFEPKFINMPEEVNAHDVSEPQRICIMPFSCGDSSFILLLLFEARATCSYDRLRDAVLACSYHVAEFNISSELSNYYNELTEREMECLSWISLGKTSDEIALIIGISRNTVNNYITSIMNKTSTKSRAEAVAEAVRSELI